MQTQISMQLGKNGLTESFKEQIKSNFKNYDNIKISVLKSGGRDKEKIKQIAQEIIKKLGAKYTYKVIGFSIFLKKWRKPKF